MINQILSTFALLFILTNSLAQTTLYYDNNCALTMKELSTHYRIAKIDTVSKVFTDEVKDFWSSDSLMLILNYNTNGKRNGLIKTFDIKGKTALNGTYTDGGKTELWEFYEGNKLISIDFNKKNKSFYKIDSLEACLSSKESFNISSYIRKNDYPSIYTLINKSKTSYNESATFTIVEEKPYFPGGMQALGQFLGAFIQYPKKAIDNKVKGKVIVEFTISKDGSTTDFKIVQGLGYGCDEEAIRVLKLLPDWVPGYQRGKAVEAKYTLPITFQ